MIRRPSFNGFACAVAALAIVLNGCGGALPSAGAPETGLTPLSIQRLAALTVRHYVQKPVHPDHGKPRMRRETQSSPLLYVGDWSSNDVYLYDYPSGTAVGTLTGFDQPYGMCVDSKGDVYIANFGSGTAVEYAHGGTTPINTYSSGGTPIGCSVDSNGDVAVTSFNPGEVTVYAGGNPSEGTTYSGQCLDQWTMGYDRSGNLIGVGTNSSGSILACALLSGAKEETTLSTSGITIDSAGGTQWDGKYIALGDQEAGGTDQTGVWPSTLSGSTLTAVSSEVTFSDTCYGDYTDDANPFFVGKTNITPGGRSGQATAMVGPNIWCTKGGKGKVDYWAYPAGGSPTGGLRGPSTLPYGAAVSIPGSSSGGGGLKACNSLETVQEVGRCHTIVMQTIVENFKAIYAEAGVQNPTLLQFLEAMLKTPGISAAMKQFIEELIKFIESYHGHKLYGYCKTAKTDFVSGLKAVLSKPHIDFHDVLAYYADEQNKYASCDGFSIGVQADHYILLDGKSTIYSAKWYKSQGELGVIPDKPFFKTILGRILLGDAGGAITGAATTGTPHGAALGALAGSIAEAINLLPG
jgi:hypothetical protein